MLRAIFHAAAADAVTRVMPYVYVHATAVPQRILRLPRRHQPLRRHVS